MTKVLFTILLLLLPNVQVLASYPNQDLKGWEISVGMTFGLVSKGLKLLHNKGHLPNEVVHQQQYEHFGLNLPMVVTAQLGPPVVKAYSSSNQVRLLIPIIDGSIEVNNSPYADLTGMELEIIAKLVAYQGRTFVTGKNLYDIVIEVLADDAVYQVNNVGAKLDILEIPQLVSALEVYIKQEVKKGKTYRIRDVEVQSSFVQQFIPQIFEATTAWINAEYADDAIFVVSGMITTNQKTSVADREKLPRSLVLPGAEMCIWVARKYFADEVLKQPIIEGVNRALRSGLAMKYLQSGSSILTNSNQPMLKEKEWDTKLVDLDIIADGKLTLKVKAVTDWKKFASKSVRYTFTTTTYVSMLPDGERVKFEVKKGPSTKDKDSKKKFWQWVTSVLTAGVSDLVDLVFDIVLDIAIKDIDFGGKIKDQVNEALSIMRKEIPYLDEANAIVSHVGFSSTGQMYLCTTAD